MLQSEYATVRGGDLKTNMKIIRADHLGMCFGVRDAIALAVQQAAAAPLTVLGELVHNETVVAGLRARGVTITGDVEAVATPAVMITAHGASERVLNQVRARGLRVLEATCPLVRVAHEAVAGLVRAGYHPVIIGRRDHVEVRGLTGIWTNSTWCWRKQTCSRWWNARASASPRKRRNRSSASNGW